MDKACQCFSDFFSCFLKKFYGKNVILIGCVYNICQSNFSFCNISQGSCFSFRDGCLGCFDDSSAGSDGFQTPGFAAITEGFGTGDPDVSEFTCHTFKSGVRPRIEDHT